MSPRPGPWSGGHVGSTDKTMESQKGKWRAGGGGILKKKKKS